MSDQAPSSSSSSSAGDSGGADSGGGGSGGGGSRKRPRGEDPSDDVITTAAGAAAAAAAGSSEDGGGGVGDEELVSMDELFGDHDALYGASSDTECTFNRGYLPRQPVYSCRTCATDGPAAICYGCAKRCHDGHDLLELYSKRGLCCDCGNAKFDAVRDPATGEKFACQLCEFKTLNRDNKYNQNFAGLYCVCARPYPDPDCSTEEEMMQCAVCEDWYHTDHLELPEGGSANGLATADSYEELVCQLCSARLPYLWHYSLMSDADALAGSTGKLSDSSAKQSDTSAKQSDTSAKQSDTSVKQSDTPVKQSDTPVKQSDTPVKQSDIPVKQSDTSPKQSDTPAGPSDIPVKQQSDTPAGPSDIPVKQQSDTPAGPSDGPTVGGRCLLAEHRGRRPPSTSAFLMPTGWRRRLCRCAGCLAAYAGDGVAFLTDPEDSLAEFEQANRRAAEEQSRPENVLRSLASAGVPHVSVQLVASAIGDFRRGLTRAMASVLADKDCGDGQPAVITREDADRILAMMAPLLAKRARFQPPDTCRKD